MVSTSKFAHTKYEERNRTGENLYMFDGYSSLTSHHYAESGKEATDCFCAEIKDFDFKRPEHCHFSQAIWWDTQKNGSRIAAGSRGVYMVFRYFPV